MIFKNILPRQIITVTLLSIGIASNAPGDTASTAALEKQMLSYDIFMKEMGSSAMFKNGPFNPKTGDVELDDILTAYHQMYIAENAGDLAKTKELQNKIKALLQKWKDEQEAKLNAENRALDNR